MRILACLLLAAASLPAFAATPAETMDAFQRALAEGKRDAALALLSPKVRIFESGYTENSRDEYAAHHLDSDIDFLRTTRSHLLRHEERRDGATAIVMRETETTGSYKDAEVHVFGLETAVLEKVGDGWQIVHLHWSSRKAQAK
ncbi:MULTISPECIES: nuclear transport factor 2 family protein [unclassified Duganella]|uniref:nuclear transport factor 2 family protein n=1 Tax=unclassified Duganella TaxID=2636909 RepID=UPI0006FD40AD|nr:MULTISPECIES: nuclear transport factor 2 family protein [unclassified Duganella]KQV45417.1 protein kinase [Duganella sp. Root336D2]KRB93610.1 protein kinase [Duganella sp. Root198D2]